MRFHGVFGYLSTKVPSIIVLHFIQKKPVWGVYTREANAHSAKWLMSIFCEWTCSAPCTQSTRSVHVAVLNNFERDFTHTETNANKIHQWLSFATCDFHALLSRQSNSSDTSTRQIGLFWSQKEYPQLQPHSERKMVPLFCISDLNLWPTFSASLTNKTTSPGLFVHLKSPYSVMD